MTATQGESSIDTLSDLAAEIRFSKPDTRVTVARQAEIEAELTGIQEPTTTEPDQIGMGELNLGEGPFDPGPAPSEEEVLELGRYLHAQEAAQASSEQETREVVVPAERQEPDQAKTASAATSDVSFQRPLSMEELECVEALDDPLVVSEPERDREQIIRALGETWAKNQSREKKREPRKSKLSPEQLAANEHRKTPAGRIAYNNRQNEVRWQKAEDEGRTIRRRKSLKDVAVEEKVERNRQQAAERQRKRRAKKKMTHPTS
tara:strand:- start:2583 stop:3368 length:786 start_codon:yes stop_codon:yes gene_type:complete